MNKYSFLVPTVRHPDRTRTDRPVPRTKPQNVVLRQKKLLQSITHRRSRTFFFFLENEPKSIFTLYKNNICELRLILILTIKNRVFTEMKTFVFTSSQWQNSYKNCAKKKINPFRLKNNLLNVKVKRLSRMLGTNTFQKKKKPSSLNVFSSLDH